MTEPNERVDKQSAVIHHLALDITRALEHAQRELSQADVWASDTMPERVSGTPGGSPVESERLLAVYDMRGLREDLRDWIDTLEAHSRKGRRLVEQMLGKRLPGNELFDAADYGVRCRHADCTNWASPHHIHHPGDGTRTEINDWCDQHWVTTACRTHGDHPHEGRRVDGLLVCEAAYRKHLRSTVKSVA